MLADAGISPYDAGMIFQGFSCGAIISEQNEDLGTLPERVRLQSIEQPDRPVLTFLDDSLTPTEAWTAADLDRRARSIATHLQSIRLERQPVILAYPSSLEFAAAFLGCLYAGSVPVPASLPRSHGLDDRLTTIIDDCMAPIVLTLGKHEASVARAIERTTNVRVASTDALPERSTAWQPREWNPNEIAFLQYTSGSTRSPRGVMVSHANLAANLHAMHVISGTTPASRGVTWLPLFHDMGLIGGLLEPLWVGYPAYLMAPSTFLQNPMRWLEAISKFKGTVSGGPNFAYQACVDAATPAVVQRLDLSSWELAANGAEPVRASTLDKFCATFEPAGFRRESMTPGFGMAEATLMVTGSDGSRPPLEYAVDEHLLRSGIVKQVAGDSPAAKRLISSGRPSVETEIRIVDPEALCPAADDQVGEVWVRNSSVAQGYWQKPEETEATFRALLPDGTGPFLRTGDLGFLHQGELFVTGRLKDVIVIRGANYYPHDIEQTVATSHPALRADACAVVGLEEASGVRLVVVQEVRRDRWRTIEPDTIVEAVRRAVAREHQLAIGAVILLKPLTLPKTTSGKVQRAECRAALTEGRLAALHEWWAPALRVAPIDFTGEPLHQPGVLERQLVEWLKRELALTDLAWNTPLMELGIDSLKGVELGAALSAAFDRTFSATLLIDYPTIAALAGFIRDEVLEPKPGPAPEQVAVPVTTRANALSADQIEALDEADLDAMLRASIEDVLKSGG